MLLSDSYMKSLCSKIASDIKKVQFKVNGEWIDGHFTGKSSGINVVSIAIVLTNTEALVIKGIRFVDSSDEVVAEISENITKGTGSVFSGVFEIEITERKESV